MARKTTKADLAALAWEARRARVRELGEDHCSAYAPHNWDREILYDLEEKGCGDPVEEEDVLAAIEERGWTATEE